MGVEAQWMYVTSNRARVEKELGEGLTTEAAPPANVMTPAQWASLFKESELTADKVKPFFSEMSTQTNAWFDDFRKAGGVKEVVKCLAHQVSSKHPSTSLCTELAKIISSWKTNRVAVINMISSAGVIESLVFCIASPLPDVKNAVLKILTEMSNEDSIGKDPVDSAAPLILEALDHFSYKKQEKRKYENLVSFLSFSFFFQYLFFLV